MKTDQRAELVPLDLDVIRVETALSRFPVHRLAKTGTVCIDLREVDGKGETAVRWEVGYHSKYGQPGPLAYKLDTLVINRRIEAVCKPTPKIVRLGSLREIAEATGTGDGHTNDVKRALYQNASAFITAKIGYRSTGGAERTLEAGFTRYAVVFTGERLPDGRAADAVYLVLSDIYMQVLDGAVARPLDYSYLRELPPASQRWYELASYAMFATLKHHRPTARLGYAEFCMYAPQIRYAGFGPMRKQMAKIHAAHLRSGYIAGVAFEATTGRDGRPDWMMIYTPGPKAEAEYRAFTQRGGRPVVIEAGPEPEAEPTGLERELIDRGVSRDVAAELVREYPEDQVKAQLGNLDAKRQKVKDPGAWLSSAIRKGYAVPAGPKARVEPAAVPAVDRAGQDQARKAAQAWKNLPVGEQGRIDAAALADADPADRAAYEAQTDPTMQRLMMVPLRDAYLAKLTAVE